MNIYLALPTPPKRRGASGAASHEAHPSLALERPGTARSCGHVPWVCLPGNSVSGWQTR